MARVWTRGGDAAPWCSSTPVSGLAWVSRLLRFDSGIIVQFWCSWFGIGSFSIRVLFCSNSYVNSDGFSFGSIQDAGQLMSRSSPCSFQVLFGCLVRVMFGSELVNGFGQVSQLTQLTRSTQSNGSTFRHKDLV
ncbi:hypothetical protein HanRHA438_Chr01g0007811 [Helianthus annuus]|nr:hypothetical protein HanRHA438_Chr01g0007811 [Helianthus annuus]